MNVNTVNLMMKNSRKKIKISEKTTQNETI